MSRFMVVYWWCSRWLVSVIDGCRVGLCLEPCGGLCAVGCSRWFDAVCWAWKEQQVVE
jgi:hypothetical protein